MKITFKLNSEKHAQLKKMAEETGITMSAYVGYVMGEHLRVKAQVEPMLIGSMLDSVKNINIDNE